MSPVGMLLAPAQPVRIISNVTSPIALPDLVGREIEFEPTVLPPAIIGERVLGNAHLLLFGPNEIKDGDTIGVSASEHIRVRHASKGNLSVTPVVNLQYQING